MIRKRAITVFEAHDFHIAEQEIMMDELEEQFYDEVFAEDPDVDLPDGDSGE